MPWAGARIQGQEGSCFHSAFIFVLWYFHFYLVLAVSCSWGTILSSSLLLSIWCLDSAQLLLFFFFVLLLTEKKCSKSVPLLVLWLVAYNGFFSYSLGPSMHLSSAACKRQDHLTAAGDISVMHRTCWLLVQRSQASNQFTELSVGDAIFSKLLEMLIAWNSKIPPLHKLLPQAAHWKCMYGKLLKEKVYQSLMSKEIWQS